MMFVYDDGSVQGGGVWGQWPEELHLETYEGQEVHGIVVVHVMVTQS